MARVVVPRGPRYRPWVLDAETVDEVKNHLANVCQERKQARREATMDGPVRVGWCNEMIDKLLALLSKLAKVDA